MATTKKYILIVVLTPILVNTDWSIDNMFRYIDGRIEFLDEFYEQEYNEIDSNYK